VSKATYGQSLRYRKTSAAKLGEWKTASHVERQANKKEDPAKPAPPKPTP
jgi:hypothetical protein